MSIKIDTLGEHATNADASAPAVFTMLADTRRRHALYELLNHDGSLSIHHLALTVAAWETEQPISSVDTELYRRVLAALHHVHIPKLVDADLVEYDDEQNRVALTDSAARLEVILGKIAEMEFA